METLDNLIMNTQDVLDILTSSELSDSEKIEELVCEGYDYEDIIQLALLVENGKKQK
jgi:hypothetical protein